jgi:hypothetical protein
MPKKVYGVVGYENAGKRFTRTTDREYSHVVVVNRMGEDFIYGYCGRIDLAESLFRQVQNRYFDQRQSVSAKICPTYRVK